MSGFKNFILRGSLVELAVAFVMATAFAAVVTAFVALIMGLIGKAGGHADFSSYKPGGLLVGVFITTVISFVVIGAVVYYLVVTPYTKAKERYFPGEAEGTPADIALLEEIRDLLVAQGGGTASTATPPPTT